MNIFNRFRSYPRPVTDAEHLLGYLDTTNGRDIRGQFTGRFLETVLDVQGDAGHEDAPTVTAEGNFVKVPTEESREEVDKIYFVPSDLSDMVRTGHNRGPILVAAGDRLVVDAAALAVRSRYEVPAPRSSDNS